MKKPYFIISSAVACHNHLKTYETYAGYMILAHE